MAATFLGLRDFLSFLLLFMYLSCFFVTDFHPNVLCVLDNQLTQTKRCFSCSSGRSCFIIHRPITIWNKHGCTSLLLPSRDLTICMNIDRNPGPPYSLLNAHLSAVSFHSMPARHSSTTSNGLANVFARKVYTRGELFSIRAQSHRWSNHFFCHRLKSLGIFTYRSRRSGFSSKLCLRTNNQAIPVICSRRCKEDMCASYNILQTFGFGTARLARKPSLNLITIECQTTVSKISTAKPAGSLQFVPSLFFSNVMSLAPKIDIVNNVAIDANVDVVCITETWLQSHIPDSVVAINGYNLIRRDRRDAVHGGVCRYAKVSTLLLFREIWKWFFWGFMD